jgi:hypothetical protein
MRLQQGFTTGGMGSNRLLRRNNPQDRMSALGQKRTSAHLRIMSALPPKADVDHDGRDVRFVPEAEVGNLKGVMAVVVMAVANFSPGQ